MGPGPADVERQIYSYTPPYLPFKRQGGLLRIAAQEPNLPRSPSLLSPILVIRSRLTAAEVCTGPDPADVERQIHSYASLPYLLTTRQGGLLSIVTQQPNLPRSPSLLSPVLVSGRD